MRKRIFLSLSLLTFFSFRLMAACGSPTVNTNNVTINSFVANWTAVPTAVNYEYILDQSPATPVTPGTATTNTLHVFTGLIPATTYYVHIRTYCGVANGYSAWVNTMVTTLALPPCNAPTGLIAYGFTNFSATITWIPVAGAVSYQFVLNQNPATPFIQGIPTAVASYNASGLQPATTYYFHLRTDCSAYTGDTSAWEMIQFTTPPLPLCNAPTSISATNVTSTSADLSWSSQNGILGWEFAVDQTPGNPVSGTLSTSNAISVSGLTSLTTYYLHLRTDCSPYSGDTSHWVSYSFITYPDSCTQATGLQISFVAPSTAFASWNAAPGAYAYEYIIDQSPQNPAEGGSPTFNTYEEVTGLASSTTYYLHVRTVCDTSFYTNNYTNWVTQPFYTQPGLKVANVTGNADFTVSAFPNPVVSTVEVGISGAQEGHSSLSLMDITGKLLKNIAVDGRKKVAVDMGGLAPGLYLLRYADDGKTFNLRLTKQ